MKNLIFFGCLLLKVYSAPAQTKTLAMPVKIKWAPAVQGNFSFTSKWSYPEGIERNKYGQLICDGFCPTEVERMIDSKGKIIKDSLSAFYKIVDTSHQSFSIQCKAWCYEWAGTDFIEAVQTSGDTVYCYTLVNAATHCSLQLKIAGDDCFAVVDLNSIVMGRSARYNCTKGYITIDKTLWEKGIMKAVFSFDFEHKEDTKRPIYWNGKILTRIKTS